MSVPRGLVVTPPCEDFFSSVLIDWQTLRDGLHDHSIHELSNGITLPVASIRRMCCVLPWEHGGATDLPDLLPLCSKCHHLVHDGGWTLTMRTDRSITLTSPDHAVTIEGPPVRARSTGPPRAA